MSSSLPNLMRLNRWKLDEKRRLLGEMEKLAEQIQQDILALDVDALERPLDANMEKKKKQKLSRKEQSFLDDLGLELHRRKNCS